MAEGLRLLAVAAHPDDESLGWGGTLAKYAAEGVQTYLATATRGERGWFGDEADNPGLEALGRIREGELRSAADVLGIGRVDFLDYIDGDLDQADPVEAAGKIAALVREIRPQVVITFGPDGAYGHPDHIAICQFTTAALVCASDAKCHPNQAGDYPPHSVAKLYYMLVTRDEMRIYQSVFGDLVMHIDGVERRSAGWDEWAVTAQIDVEEHWPTVWRAVSCHRTQLPGYSDLLRLPEEQHKLLWGQNRYYRAYSLVNGGRKVETDLFAGLR